MIKYWSVYLLLVVILIGCPNAIITPTVLLPTPSMPSPTATTKATFIETASIPSTLTIPIVPLLTPTASWNPTSTPFPTITSLPLLSSKCGLYMPILPASLPQPTPMQETNPNQSLDNIPEDARSAVSFLLNNPGDVALVVYRVGQEEQGIFHNPDMLMPTASTVKVVHLLAYAEAVNAGNLNPANWIPLTDLDNYYLPNSDLNAHTYALEDLTEQGLIAGDSPQVPLEQVPWMMIRHSSNTATDYLHQLLGQETIEKTALRWGLTNHTAPCPFIGQFLLMGNHTRTMSDSRAIQNYQNDPLGYGADVIRFTDAYSLSPDFNAQEQAWRSQSRRPNYNTQELFTHILMLLANSCEFNSAGKFI